MSKTKNAGDYSGRLDAALKALPHPRARTVITEHEPAYRVVNAIQAGLVAPDGLTDEGHAALAKLGEQLGEKDEQHTVAAEGEPDGEPKSGRGKK